MISVKREKWTRLPPLVLTPLLLENFNCHKKIMSKLFYDEVICVKNRIKVHEIQKKNVYIQELKMINMKVLIKSFS